MTPVLMLCGVVVPVPALETVIACERQGLRLWLDGAGVTVEGPLSDDDRLSLSQWQPQIAALLRLAPRGAYRCGGGA